MYMLSLLCLCLTSLSLWPFLLVWLSFSWFPQLSSVFSSKLLLNIFFLEYLEISSSFLRQFYHFLPSFPEFNKSFSFLHILLISLLFLISEFLIQGLSKKSPQMTEDIKTSWSAMLGSFLLLCGVCFLGGEVGGSMSSVEVLNIMKNFKLNIRQVAVLQHSGLRTSHYALENDWGHQETSGSVGYSDQYLPY